MKLLNRTIQNYVLYSALLLFLSTPLFYFSIQHLFIKELDKVLKSHKVDFYEALAHLKTDDDLNFFQLMNKEFILLPASKNPLHDTLYTVDLYDSVSAHMIPHRVFSMPATINGRAFELQIRESMVSSTSLIAAIMGIQFISLTLLLAGLVFINRKLSRKIWGPFYVILDLLKKYKIEQEGKLELPRASTAEFRDLSNTITQLVDKNHEAYLIQKEFTENASHELQTPLAICRTKLELLAQTKELTQEQADLVGTLLDAMDRITRLNKDLLLLSKIENRQFFDREEIDVNSTVQKITGSYMRIAEEKNINVEYHAGEGVVINANPVLFDVLISNLISNAMRYSTPGGNVTIESTPGYFTVKNSGLPMAHPEKIFQRFHRESRTTPGSGLGLSIVKKVCDVSGYQIAYNFDSSMHQFKITFPH